MLRTLVLLLITLLVGCATQPIPKPAPSCDMTVAGKCHEMSPGEKAGPGVRGHSKDVAPAP